MISALKKYFKKIISITLTKESDNSFRSSLLKFKNHHKDLIRRIYGTANDEEIIESIASRIEPSCEVLMVHNSFDGMVPMYIGNLINLLEYLIKFCQRNNITLAMPTFFAGTNNAAKEYYQNKNNIFDVRKTISEIGLLTELFRFTHNVKRSIHPTHSVCALGPKAEELTRNHHNVSTTFGSGTPFEIMIKYKTTILGIGTKIHQSLSQIHTAEDIMDNNYPIQLYTDSMAVTCIDNLGNKLNYYLRIKNPDFILDRKSFFKILEKVEADSWNYKGIPFYTTQACDVTNTFIDAAKRGQIMYKMKAR